MIHKIPVDLKIMKLNCKTTVDSIPVAVNKSASRHVTTGSSALQIEITLETWNLDPQNEGMQAKIHRYEKWWSLRVEKCFSQLKHLAKK